MTTLEMTWGDKIEARGMRKGRREGRREGRQEGRQEGMRGLLLEQMEERFGPLSDAVRWRVETVTSPAELSRLARRVLTAASPAEMGLE